LTTISRRRTRSLHHHKPGDLNAMLCWGATMATATFTDVAANRPGSEATGAGVGHFRWSTSNDRARRFYFWREPERRIRFAHPREGNSKRFAETIVAKEGLTTAGIGWSCRAIFRQRRLVDLALTHSGPPESVLWRNKEGKG